MTEEQLKHLELYESLKDPYVTNWEKTGLLDGITELKDRRNMATMLETQAQWLLREAEKFADESVPSIMQEQYIQQISGIVLPLVRRVFGPNISRYGAMNLPAGLSEEGEPIVCKTVNMNLRLPHISKIYDRDLIPFNNLEDEQEYVDTLAEKIRDWFDDEIQKTEKRVGKPLKFYIYMPIILGTIRNIEDLTPSHFSASTRFAVRAISDD